jgi:hypothetical protein
MARLVVLVVLVDFVARMFGGPLINRGSRNVCDKPTTLNNLEPP